MHMLDLTFIMSKQKKKSMKAVGKRDKSPSPQISETDADADLLLPTPTPTEEVTEPTISQESTSDIDIPHPNLM